MSGNTPIKHSGFAVTALLAATIKSFYNSFCRNFSADYIRDNSVKFEENTMKIYLTTILAIIISLSACSSSKPKVKEVPITEPWLSMNLPCKNEGVVVLSNDHRLNCAYGGERNRDRDLKTIAPYVELFKKNGWKLTREADVAIEYLFEKGDQELLLISRDPSIITNGETQGWKGLNIQIETWTKK